MVAAATRRAAQQRVIDAVWREIVRILAVHPVPVTDSERTELALLILQPILRGRAESRRMALAQLSELAPQGVTPPTPRSRLYGLPEVEKMLSNVVSDSPAGGRVMVENLDPDTQRVNRTRVLIDESTRDTPEVREAFEERVQRSVATHVEAGYRDTVMDAAAESTENGGLEDGAGRRVRLGYARVLTGAESCSFCAMLASRGAEYETARSAGQGRQFHRGCDCEVVPVYEGEPWEGQDAADALYELWKDNADMSTFRKAWKKRLGDKGVPAEYVGESFRK